LRRTRKQEGEQVAYSVGLKIATTIGGPPIIVLDDSINTVAAHSAVKQHFKTIRQFTKHHQ